MTTILVLSFWTVTTVELLRNSESALKHFTNTNGGKLENMHATERNRYLYKETNDNRVL